MIPKIIHYCWFGGNPKSELVKKCINSWKKFCPDYEIIEWNESNIDIKSNAYMEEAYENKKWAFVSDVARLMVVYNMGGFYLDTDVELFDSLNHLIIYDSVFAFESDLNINTGIGFGAIKGHGCVEQLLNSYENRKFIINGKMDLLPCPSPNTEVIMKNYEYFIRNGTTQILDNNIILSTSDYAKLAKHHGAQSWNDGEKWGRKGSYKDTRKKRFLRRPGNYMYIEEKFGKKAVKIYTFLSYDLLEVGVWYYVKRLYVKYIKRKR